MKPSPARALASLVSRARLGSFTLEDFCGGHTPQLGFTKDRSPYIHVMCARQSGKTQGDGGIMLDNGLNAPGSTNLFLGLNGTAVRTSVWEPVWKSHLFHRYHLPDWHNETRMLTAFPNGARVLFAGTDDMRHVKSYLGNRLANGVVIIDEAQDQSDAVLRYILTVLLPPMLTSTSRVILSGVLPDVPAGYFYELAAPGGNGWSHHEWGRAANVHTPNAMAELAEYMRLHNLAESDPQIQRDWYMRRAWDMNATAYRYETQRNGYLPTRPAWADDVTPDSGRVIAAVPHDGIDRFTVAIDPGSADRSAVEVWGWGDTTEEIQHVFDWSSERNARLSWSQIAKVLKVIQDNFDPECWFYDAGSSKNELDTFQADYGIPVIKAANKGDLPGQVRRVNDVLQQGRAKVMIGSKLEEDYLKARWDTEARSRGQWKWAPQWHPDPSEAARYALAGYFNSFQPAGLSLSEGERIAQAQRFPKRSEFDDLGDMWTED